uniref:F-box domain-containing protein n=1 Tax=Parastrongyloides trichosuri TaxID=131310 RepID=A0A0N5A772_PARTI
MEHHLHEEVGLVNDNNADNATPNNDTTAVDTVMGDVNLMKLIIRQIPPGSARSNLRLQCRMYNNICTMKSTVMTEYDQDKSNVPHLLYNYHFVPRRTTHFENSFTLNIPQSFRIEGLNSRELKTTYEKLRAAMYCIDTLIIRNVSESFLTCVGNLLNFENIKTLVFHSGKLSFIPVNIFKSINSLKPEQVVFYKENRLYFHGRENNFNYFGSTMPDSVKTIWFHKCSDEVDSLYQMFRECEIGRFGNLKLSSDFHAKMILPEEEFKMRGILKCFKHVTMCLMRETGVDIQPTVRYLLKDAFNDQPTWTMDCYMILWCINSRHNQPSELFGFREIDKYASIRYLTLCKDPMNRIYVEPLDTRALSSEMTVMSNLTTLTVDITLISSFEKFCESLCSSLKNIKLNGCSKLDPKHLKFMSKYCKNLEVISLNDVKSSLITYKTIIEDFKKVQFLDICYHKSYVSSEVISAIENDGKVEFPSIKFLMIKCKRFTNPELSRLRSLLHRTPRKPGQFLIHYLTNALERKRKYNEIVMQKHTAYYSHYNTIFSYPLL